MRLFSAFPVPAAAADTLRRRLAAVAGPRGGGLRWTAQDGWHLTLGFYGADDPLERRAWLADRLAGMRAPVLRIAGAGTFPGVLWAGVEAGAAGRRALADIAAAARPDTERRPFRAHVTLPAVVRRPCSRRGRPPWRTTGARSGRRRPWSCSAATEGPTGPCTRRWAASTSAVRCGEAGR
ncbi:hypothetical protein BJF85_09155 [Saccharomonospora sp. CUA-673]|uniref:2'-5' RNA ligase family protein n=1 Tax=Saccharomonospora sp. CUA-673 TaxID=1904969 RepID=UPI0009693420|nr:2'-5' RNA ligase family protein [Saccharomonospora sp. CUA-673]OLT38493.1 hypothetical protein BJF85_09155 [Saccharomonospora sp. CUA-673]